MERYEATARKAFEAIQDLAISLLKYKMDDEVRNGLRDIESIARYNFNPRPPGKTES